jgi:hypothetical protein
VQCSGDPRTHLNGMHFGSVFRLSGDQAAVLLPDNDRALGQRFAFSAFAVPGQRCRDVFGLAVRGVGGGVDLNRGVVKAEAASRAAVERQIKGLTRHHEEPIPVQQHRLQQRRHGPGRRHLLADGTGATEHQAMRGGQNDGSQQAVCIKNRI